MPVMTKAEKAKYDNGGIGENQTWQDVTSERVAGTEYVNDTGKTIVLNITLKRNESAPDHIDGYITVDGIGFSYIAANPTLYSRQNIYFIIPNNSTYKLAISTKSIISLWAELR